jgi:DNA (cytosine-5)-methyltransferase 1
MPKMWRGEQIERDYPLACGVISMAHGQGGAEIGFNRGPTLTCNHEAPIAVYPAVAHSLRGEGFDASEDGTGRGTPLVPVIGVDGYNGALSGDIAATMGTRGSSETSSGPQVMVPVAFHPTQDPIASTDGTTHCMGTGSSQGGATVAVAYAIQAGAIKTNPMIGPDGVGVRTDDCAYTIEARAEVQGVAYTTKLHNTKSNQAGKVYAEYSTSLDRSSPPPALLTAMQVRRLTPVECERLQGFPDGYTEIPWRKKPASECPDGPRYKACGNSWAMPNIRWFGWRIQRQLEAA